MGNKGKRQNSSPNAPSPKKKAPAKNGKNKGDDQSICQVCSTQASDSYLEGGVECCVCKWQWHMKCIKIAKPIELAIKTQQDAGMDNSWMCTICDKAWKKINSEVREARIKLVEHDKRITKVETTSEDILKENQALKKQISDLEKKVANTGADNINNTKKVILSEVAEQTAKSRNMIIHGLPASKEENVLEKVMDLFQKLNLNIPKQAIQSTRRKGNGTNGEANPSSGPVVVTFRRARDRDDILDSGYMLSRNAELKRTSFCPDLTSTQRQAETDLNTECCSKNLNRSASDVQGRWVWKPIGRKGEKVARKVVLGDQELVLDSGRVVKKGSYLHKEQTKKKAQPRDDTHPPQAPTTAPTPPTIEQEETVPRVPQPMGSESVVKQRISFWDSQSTSRGAEVRGSILRNSGASPDLGSSQMISLEESPDQQQPMEAQ